MIISSFRRARIIERNWKSWVRQANHRTSDLVCKAHALRENRAGALAPGVTITPPVYVRTLNAGNCWRFFIFISAKLLYRWHPLLAAVHWNGIIIVVSKTSQCFSSLRETLTRLPSKTSWPERSATLALVDPLNLLMRISLVWWGSLF